MSTKTLPATIQLFGVYTGDNIPAAGQSHWNFDSSANDALLAQQMSVTIAAQVGVLPNLYEIFCAWGDPTTYGGNAAWGVWNMMNVAYPGPLIPMISYKLEFGAPYGWDDPQALIDVAAGKQDAGLATMIDGVYASGCRMAFFRPSYEYNFDFMPDSMGWDATHQAQWKAAVEHVFSKTKTYAATKPGLVWLNVLCPAMGTGGQPALTVVPDPTLWDVYGPDFYGAYWGSGDVNDPAERQRWWLNGFDMAWTPSSAFALAHGKPMMLSETGVGGPKGIVNDPVWIGWLADQIKAFRAAGGRWWGMIQWDINASDGSWRWSDGSQPAVAAALKLRMPDLLGDPINTANPLGSAVPTPTVAPSPSAASSPTPTPAPASSPAPAPTPTPGPAMATVTVTQSLSAPSALVSVSDVTQWTTATATAPIHTQIGATIYTVVGTQSDGNTGHMLATSQPVAASDAQWGAVVSVVTGIVTYGDFLRAVVAVSAAVDAVVAGTHDTKLLADLVDKSALASLAAQITKLLA
jgi:hypothetical protein